MVETLYSISDLAKLSGLHRKTVMKRLGDLTHEDGPKQAKLYRLEAALPLLCKLSDGELKLTEELLVEKVQVERLRKEKAQLELDVMQGKLVAIEDVGRAVEAEYTAVRAHLIAIPSKLAGELSTMDKPVEIKNKLEDSINEALSELSSEQFEV